MIHQARFTMEIVSWSALARPFRFERTKEWTIGSKLGRPAAENTSLNVFGKNLPSSLPRQFCAIAFRDPLIWTGRRHLSD
jgi:hypothetical protein